MYYDPYLNEYVDNGKIVYPDSLDPYTWEDIEENVRNELEALFKHPDPDHIDELTEQFMEDEGLYYVEKDKQPDEYDILYWYINKYPEEFDEDGNPINKEKYNL